MFSDQSDQMSQVSCIFHNGYFVDQIYLFFCCMFWRPVICSPVNCDNWWQYICRQATKNTTREGKIFFRHKQTHANNGPLKTLVWLNYPDGIYKKGSKIAGKFIESVLEGFIPHLKQVPILDIRLRQFNVKCVFNFLWIASELRVEVEFWNLKDQKTQTNKYVANGCPFIPDCLPDVRTIRSSLCGKWS